MKKILGKIKKNSQENLKNLGKIEKNFSKKS